MAEIRDEVVKIRVKYDPLYPHFGLVGEPHEHKQHPNQQAGLDMYVHVINLDTGQRCHKKLYKIGQNLCFRHTGYSPVYLSELTHEADFVPHQVVRK